MTVKNYAADISLFSSFLAERLGSDFDWQKIGVLDIRAYLALLNKEKYARTTIARRISSLRSFYRFLLRENYVEQNPFVKVRTPKLEKRLPVFLEELEINEILSMPAKDRLGLRDQAILELLYATGCRVSELVGLTMPNIDLGNQYVLLLGKGNKERIVPLGHTCCEAVRQYLQVARGFLMEKYRAEVHDKVFVTVSYTHLTLPTIRLV